MNLGVRAHDFGRLPLATLADKISEKGFTCIQLALAKAISDADSSTSTLDAGLAHRVRDALGRKNVRVSVLGCYINPIHPDREERRKQLDRFGKHLALAKDFGCKVVATETGSLNPDCSYHPSNGSKAAFDDLVQSVSILAGEAEKHGVYACIEGVTRHTVSSPELMASVLDAVRSPNLKVLFDPVNLVSAENHAAHGEMIRKSFELFGDRILVIHAKDFVVRDDCVATTFAGNGSLDYGLLFGLAKRYNPEIDVLIEDLAVVEMDKAARFVKDEFERA